MQFLGKEIKRYGKPFIIAEISCNHGGIKLQMGKLIEAAKEAGADAVKIQTYTPDCLTHKKINYSIVGTQWKGRSLYELYKKTQTPFEWLPYIFDSARDIGIPCFSSVFSEAGLKALEAVKCPAYKIASAEANDIVFIQKVMKTGKPLVVSTGMTNSMDVQRLRWTNNNSLIVMHCMSEYPVKSGRENLRKLVSLVNSFPVVGYSDHSLSAYGAQYAYSVGACVFEKHFTIDYGTEDEKFSLTPPAFKLYVKYVNNAAKCFEPVGFSSETDQFKRSVFVTKPIKKGARFTENNTACFRPNIGIEAGDYPTVLISKASRDMDVGEPVTHKDMRK